MSRHTYETALKTKYTRDDESIAMIDMIVNSRVFDLGYVYDAWNGRLLYIPDADLGEQTDL